MDGPGGRSPCHHWRCDAQIIYGVFGIHVKQEKEGKGQGSGVMRFGTCSPRRNQSPANPWSAVTPPRCNLCRKETCPACNNPRRVLAPLLCTCCPPPPPPVGLDVDGPPQMWGRMRHSACWQVGWDDRETLCNGTKARNHAPVRALYVKLN